MYIVKYKWVSEYQPKCEDDYDITICETLADAKDSLRENLTYIIHPDREYLVKKLLDYLEIATCEEITEDFVIKMIDKFVENHDLFEYDDEDDCIEVSIIKVGFGDYIQI